jgi:hypothetical protein
MINIGRDINITHLSVQKNFLVQHRRQRQEVPEKCTMFSTTDWGWKIYHDDLFFPYKMHLSQLLTGGEIARSYTFVREHGTQMEGHSDGYVNKQNFTESLTKSVNSFVPCLHHMEHV